jgi:hypothetical protein
MNTLLQIIWIIHHFPNDCKVEIIEKINLFIKELSISLCHG